MARALPDTRRSRSPGRRPPHDRLSSRSLTLNRLSALQLDDADPLAPVTPYLGRLVQGPAEPPPLDDVLAAVRRRSRDVDQVLMILCGSALALGQDTDAYELATALVSRSPFPGRCRTAADGAVLRGRGRGVHRTAPGRARHGHRGPGPRTRHWAAAVGQPVRQYPHLPRRGQRRRSGVPPQRGGGTGGRHRRGPYPPARHGRTGRSGCWTSASGAPRRHSPASSA